MKNHKLKRIIKELSDMAITSIALKRSETSLIALAHQNMAATTECLPRDGYKQEEIANICDGDAPGIVIDDERGSHSVVIV